MFVSYGTLDVAGFGSIPSNAILLISLFLLIGLGTKIGVVPMHSWVPDTNSEAPIPVSARDPILSSLLDQVDSIIFGLKHDRN